jgi:hypothetical protein
MSVETEAVGECDDLLVRCPVPLLTVHMPNELNQQLRQLHGGNSRSVLSLTIRAPAVAEDGPETTEVDYLPSG